MVDPSQLSNEQLLAWSTGNNMLPQDDGSMIPPYPAQALPNGAGNPMPGQMIRRYNNAPLLAQPRIPSYVDARASPAADDSDDDDGELEARAAAAKKEATARRPPKQIPPFIQKLSSFLDDPSSYNLIRWAEDGRSFIIPDEEKFANDLIPLMFKHKNYASFVRQLNMYGFHKKVGLTDNSMRASEKKTKIPSGYQHKYFRQGRPELQWLIEKPKPGSVSAKKRTGKDTEDEDVQDDEKAGLKPTSKTTDLITLPKADLVNVKNLQKEVESLQRSQQQIYSILKQMRDENNQYIKQASAMVANHERHESSINAILQFLATFYNQSLQGRDNVSNMFPTHQPPQQHGNVVEDMGDYSESSPSFEPNRRSTPVRRPLALLPAPEIKPPVEELSSTTQPDRQRTQTKSSQPPTKQVSPQMESSNRYNSPTGNRNINDDILNVINRSNAQTTSSGTPRFDFSSALQQYADNANGTNGPLTPEQRDTMLSIMASHSGTTTPNLSNPDPSKGANSTNPSMQSYIDYFNNNEEQLSMLQRLQEEQDSRVQDLAGRLQPLSPNGSIPGLDIPPSPHSLNGNSTSAYTGAYNPNSESFDFDTFLNEDAFPLNEAPADNYTWDNLDDGFGGHGNDGPTANTDELFGDGFDVNPDDDALATGDGEVGGRIVGSVGTSSASPTPKATVEDEDATEENDGYARGTTKRRKLDR